MRFTQLYIRTERLVICRHLNVSNTFKICRAIALKFYLQFKSLEQAILNPSVLLI